MRRSSAALHMSGSSEKVAARLPEIRAAPRRLEVFAKLPCHRAAAVGNMPSSAPRRRGTPRSLALPRRRRALRFRSFLCSSL